LLVLAASAEFIATELISAFVLLPAVLGDVTACVAHDCSSQGRVCRAATADIEQMISIHTKSLERATTGKGFCAIWEDHTPKQKM